LVHLWSGLVVAIAGATEQTHLAASMSRPEPNAKIHRIKPKRALCHHSDNDGRGQVAQGRILGGGVSGLAVALAIRCRSGKHRLL